MNKPILLVVFQSFFTDFHYKLLELEHYKPEFEVVVIDLSNFFFHLSQKPSAAKVPKHLKIITPINFIDCFVQIYKLRQKLIKEPCKSSFSIYGATVFSFKSIIFHILFLITLKKYFFCVVRLWNGGILFHKNNTKNNNSFLSRISIRFKKISNIFELKQYCKTKLFEILAKILPFTHTHVLVAGSDWLNSLKFSGLMRKNTQTILGHSFDYSACLLLDNLKKINTTNRLNDLVYLDTGSPMFLGDSKFSRRRQFYTSDKWYPSLCRIFNFIEKFRGGAINIASHYKARHSKRPYYFGFRKVIFNQAQDLIVNSQEVISVGSTATSFAIFYKKPIIFLTSNQLNKDHEFFLHIREMSNLLNAPLINIDDFTDKWPLPKPFVNYRRYNEYISRCLTSTKLKKPNFYIIKKIVLGNFL